jgi:hypothetical protein
MKKTMKIVAVTILAVTMIVIFLLPAANSVEVPPVPDTSWQWQLSTSVNTTVLDDVSGKKLYDIDLFDNSTAAIKSLKDKGVYVSCYFSAGSRESGRPDSNLFPDAVRGNKMQGWPEDWLDIRAGVQGDIVRRIMAARMDLAVAKGCDAGEPDNIDGYSNNTGFNLTASDQLEYNKWLADTAHAKGLHIALKNDTEQVRQLVDSFDFAVNEECYRYRECDVYDAFINQNKAVFIAEYSNYWTVNNFRNTVCPQANASNFDAIFKNLDLDAFRVSCRESSGSSSPATPQPPAETPSPPPAEPDQPEDPVSPPPAPVSPPPAEPDLPTTPTGTDQPAPTPPSPVSPTPPTTDSAPPRTEPDSDRYSRWHRPWRIDRNRSNSDSVRHSHRDSHERRTSESWNRKPSAAEGRYERHRSSRYYLKWVEFVNLRIREALVECNWRAVTHSATPTWGKSR